MKKYHISTDKAKLDLILIYDYLSNDSYWAKGCSLSTVEKSIEHSLCFGIYDSRGNQVGFSRAVTDFATFAWIMDVFILPDHRGNGLSKMLMKEMLTYPGFNKLRRIGLNTKDAQGLYLQFGFKPSTDPNLTLTITRKPS